jgi:hypothetical protein
VDELLKLLGKVKNALVFTDFRKSGTCYEFVSQDDNNCFTKGYREILIGFVS